MVDGGTNHGPNSLPEDGLMPDENRLKLLAIDVNKTRENVVSVVAIDRVSMNVWFFGEGGAEQMLPYDMAANADAYGADRIGKDFDARSRKHMQEVADRVAVIVEQEENPEHEWVAAELAEHEDISEVLAETNW